MNGLGAKANCIGLLAPDWDSQMKVRACTGGVGAQTWQERPLGTSQCSGWVAALLQWVRSGALTLDPEVWLLPTSSSHSRTSRSPQNEPPQPNPAVQSQHVHIKLGQPTSVWLKPVPSRTHQIVHLQLHMSQISLVAG